MSQSGSAAAHGVGLRPLTPRRLTDRLASCRDAPRRLGRRGRKRVDLTDSLERSGAVEDAGEAGGVGADGELLEDADAVLGGAVGAEEGGRRQTAWMWTLSGRVGASTGSASRSPPTTDSPCQLPWPHSGCP